MANPPLIIRLWAMNCLSSSAIAGPDQAIQPSLARNRRCCSRGSRASRSCSWRTKSIRDCAVLIGSSIWKPVRASQPGMSMRLKTWSAMKSAAPAARFGGQVHRQRGQGVDGRTERDDAREVLRPPVGGGLVGEHAALGVAGEVDVAVGDLLDRVDGLAQRDDVVGQVALHAALDLVGRAEVDDPGVDARGVQDADGALVAGDVPHVGRHHHRVHHQHRRARRAWRPAGCPAGSTAAADTSARSR